MYERAPGAAVIGERLYRVVAAHRPFFSFVTTIGWGPTTQPSTYAVANWFFLRGLGLVYLIAFLSLALQIRGLVGHDGILPAREYMAAARGWADAHQLGLDRLRVLPTLAWFDTSDAFLEGLSVGGAALASLLILGVAPALLLPLLWVGYLSLAVVCRDFLSYQWDALLLETGFLAIFVAPLVRWDRFRRIVDPPRVAVWLLWFLLFRLMFGSGIVKLASGDPTWRTLTALTFHFETQPLPTPAAWYAHQLPRWCQQGSTLLVLGIELAVPWLIFAPRRLRAIGGTLLVSLQGLIGLTGNYAFFNPLSTVLCLLLFDDTALTRLAAVLRTRIRVAKAAPAHALRWPSSVLVAVGFLTVPPSVEALTRECGVRLWGAATLAPLVHLIQPFRSVNAYGLFAIMSTTRLEIVVEGSNDGVTWLAYEFTDKPGEERRRPSWVAPHQPRLDWQMWFAALGSYEDSAWFERFCRRLLEGSPSVLRLLARDPFDGTPPLFVRGALYRYRFADAATNRTQGVWWVREHLGLYSPAWSLERGAARGSALRSPIPTAAVRAALH